MREVIVGILDLVVAPETVGFILFQLDVELAISWRILRDSTVITEGRIVVIRINSPKERVRRFVRKIGKDLLQGAFACIRTHRCDQKC